MKTTPTKTLNGVRHVSFCPCGEPAVRYKGSAWCCQRCHDIEERLEAGQKGMDKVRPPVRSARLEEVR